MIREAEQRLRHDAEDQGRDHAKRHGHAGEQPGRDHRGPARGRVAEEHQHDHPDVEERGDRAAEHPDDDQRQRPARDRRLEHRELPGEPAGQRDAGEGEEEEGEDARHQRRALAQAGPARQVIRLARGVTDEGHHRERADGREAVDSQIEQAGRQAGHAGGHDAGQHEPAVRDRGVGQQALHVRLGDRDDRADDHGECGHDPHERPPVPGQLAERDVEHAEQRAERGDQGAGRHQRGHRRGRALVDIRLPALERHRADLEEQPDAQQRDPRVQERRTADVGGGRGCDAPPGTPSPSTRTAWPRRTGRTPRRRRRAGSTSSPPPARAAGAAGPGRRAGTAGATAPPARRTW